MAYIKIPLVSNINIHQIYTLYYFDFSPKFSNHGETHNFWEMIYVDSGELDLYGDERKYHLKQGEMLFHQPNEFHRIQCDGIHAASVFIASFDCRSATMKFFRQKRILLSKEVRETVKELIAECSRNFKISVNPLIRLPDAPRCGLQMIRIELEKLLIQIIRQEEAQRSGSPIFFTSQKELEDNLAKDLIAYLKSHVESHISLEQLSKQFHFGISTLCGIFKRNTGKSIIHYHLELKIDESKRLLRESELAVNVISAKLGFESPQYFSRIFKKYVGITPLEFRNTLVDRSNVHITKKN